MAQTIYGTINPNTTSGTQLAQILNDFKDAVVTGFSGTARPPNLQAGGYWVDTTNAGSPTFYWDVKLYTGMSDVVVYRINLNSLTSSISSGGELFTIEKVSADEFGPVLKLLKERLANSGQVLSGDILGEIQFVSGDNIDANPVVARIKAVAADAHTNVDHSGYLVFEATKQDSIILEEMMRLIDGKLGVGLTLPEAIIHAKGATGIKSEYQGEDALGAKLVLKKKRTLVNGQVKSGDVIGSLIGETTDEMGAGYDVAKVEVIATEDHTATAQGSKIVESVKANGSAIYTPVVEKTALATEIKNVAKVNLLEMPYVEYPAGTFTGLNATKSIVVITGTGDTTISGALITAGLSKVITIHNRSTGTVSITNQDAAATGAQFKLPKLATIKVLANSSAEFFYHDVEGFWKVKSGSGGGSGAGGSGTPDWKGLAGEEPVEVEENFMMATVFEAGLTNALYAYLKVPQGYVAGSPVLMALSFYNPSTVGNYQMRLTTTLIKAGAAISSSAGTLTSDSGPLTTAVVDQIKEYIFTVVNSVGQVGAGTVAPGDYLVVKLERITGTSTADVKFIKSSTEVIY